jgi:two-component system sensor histidine kinase/response regulator
MNNSEAHVLVVDDMQDNLKVVSNFLKEEGYKIALAFDGKSALKIIDSHPVDLILLDIMMPEMDGYDVCRKIKQNNKTKDIPVIFLSAKNETKDIVEGFQVGGVDYILKPFYKEELLARVQTHVELAVSKKRIVELNKSRDKLYSIIAHDIRSPLASIKLTIEALLDGVLEPGSDEYKEIIFELNNTTDNTFQLLNDLLAWAKTQKESAVLNPRIIDIDFIINDCISLLRANADAKKISLINHLSDKENLCLIDEATIYIVFRNILSNAIKFTPENGTISFTSVQNKKNISISVSDTGVGMTKEVLDIILHTDENYTTPGTNKEMGTGLGMLMIKSFVQKNNGKMDIQSEPGKGTTVTIALPK